MNNLYRELAPITDAAWGDRGSRPHLQAAHRRSSRRRRLRASRFGLLSVSTGHLLDIAPPAEGVAAHLRDTQPLVRLRVPFTVSRTAIDDVERGSKD